MKNKEGVKMNKTVKGLTDFIKKSPTAYHAVSELEERLLKEGFTKLNENEKWNLKKGGKYFVQRSGSSIISFKIPAKDYKGFYMIASHRTLHHSRLRRILRLSLHRLMLL